MILVVRLADRSSEREGEQQSIESRKSRNGLRGRFQQPGGDLRHSDLRGSPFDVGRAEAPPNGAQPAGLTADLGGHSLDDGTNDLVFSLPALDQRPQRRCDVIDNAPGRSVHTLEQLDVPGQYTKSLHVTNVTGQRSCDQCVCHLNGERFSGDR